MKKKIIALSLAAVLLVLAVVGGTLAYLTDKDYAENTMVMGNVNIEQHEWERAADGTTLVPFTQDKPLYPAVNPSMQWADTPVYFDQIGAQGGYQKPFVEPNAVDKFVNVENTGKSDAYVRTLIAFERGTTSYEYFDKLVSYSYYDAGWSIASIVEDVAIDGHNYTVVEFVFFGRNGENGILAAGVSTQANLGQVYLASFATNEDMIALDGNNNGKYDILALSQATQTNGFADAQTALDTSFGDVNAVNVQAWFTSGDLPEYVSSAEEFADAIAAGKNIILSDDVALDAKLTVPAGSAATIDLGGNELSFVSEEAKASCAIENKGTLTITNGTVTYEGVGDPSFGYGTNTITNSGKLVIDGATIINTTNSGSSNAIDNAPGASLIVNDGVIKSEKVTIRLRDGSSATINGGEITGSRAIQIHLFQNVKADTNLTINGGTFNGSELALYSYAYGSCTFDKTNVTITGGTFNGDVAFGGGNKTAQENVTVTGGTFNGYLGRYLANDGWEDIVKP